jgi:aspartate-semialdehyde dehydrogenase
MTIPSLNHLTIAVVGATGAVGAEFLKIIEQRHPGLRNLKLLASNRSAGAKLTVNGKEFTVTATTEESFRGVDIAFISASTEASRHWAPIAVAAGAVVIDDSSAFRMQEDVPLVAPEVNGADVTWHNGIIAIPNCSTTPLVMVAHPINRVNPIRRIVADTYQSVSGAGGAAVQELREQSEALLRGQPVTPRHQPKQIGFNVIPQIDSFLDNGYTREEQKMIDESRKIMHAPDLRVSATCVRVPVMVSHSAAVHIETERAMNLSDIRALLMAMPGVTVLDDTGAGKYPMPWDVAGEDDVFVGRIRKDASARNGFALWIVSDNLRKGAALNSIQIAEELVLRECLEPGATAKPKFNFGEPESREVGFKEGRGIPPVPHG